MNTCLIIGNGFDKNLGLATGYRDFMESNVFLKLLRNSNSVARYFLSIVKENPLSENWIDLEKELYKLTIGRKASHIKDDYYLIISGLKEYLSSLNYNELNIDSQAFDLIIKPDIGDSLQIFNFNYTPTVQNIIKLKKLKQIVANVTHVHGSLEDDNIIFGVHDKADITNEFIFLKKAASINYPGSSITRNLLDYENIVFFGYSFGETDHSYFYNFFDEVIGQKLQKRIVIFYYSEAGYESIIEELDILTSQRLTLLRTLCEFVAIKSGY